MKIVTVGKKGFDALKRLHRERIIASLELKESASPAELAARVGDQITKLFR